MTTSGLTLTTRHIQTDRDIQRDNQTDIHQDIQAYRETDREGERHIERQTWVMSISSDTHKHTLA